MSLPTSGAVNTARPVLEIDGAESAELTDRVLSLVVSETTEGLVRWEVLAGNWAGRDEGGGYVFNDRGIVDFGGEIAIRLGDGDRAGTVSRGHVSAMEAHYPEDRAPEIGVPRRGPIGGPADDAADPQLRRRLGRGRHPQRRRRARPERVDRRRRARRTGTSRRPTRATWPSSGTGRAWSTPTSGSTATPCTWSGAAGGRAIEITLTYNADLHEVSVLADLAQQRSAVVVAGWDVAAKEAIVATADLAAIQPELGVDTSGVELLEQSFRARTESVVHTAPATSAEAQAEADMALRTSARRFVVATGRAEGDARLRVGTPVRLAGLGPGFTGTYTLVEVEHPFDVHLGYQTRFRAERPAWGWRR